MTDQNRNIRGAIIAAEKSHIEKMVKIFQQGQDQHQKWFPEIFCSADQPEKIATYLSRYLKLRNPLRARRNFSLIWSVENEVAGYILYQRYSFSNVFFGNNRYMCFVDDIAIDEEFQSQGGSIAFVRSCGS